MINANEKRKSYSVRKYLGLAGVIISFCIIVGVLLPFSVGKIIKISLPKKLANLNIDVLSPAKIQLIELKTGIYSSIALLKVDIAIGKQNIISLNLEEKLQHGPIILDFKHKTLHFKLAKVLSEIRLNDSENIRLDPENIKFDSFLDFSGKYILGDHLSNLSIYFKSAFSRNTWFQMKLDNLDIKTTLGLFNKNFEYNLKIKNFSFFDDKNIFKFNFKDLLSSINFKPSEFKHKTEFSFDNFSFKKGNRDILVLNECRSESFFEPVKDLSDILLNINIKNMILLDRTYGPCKLEVACKEINLKKYQNTLEKLQGTKNSDLKPIKDFLRGEKIEATINHLTMQIPEGEISAKGRMKFLPATSTELSKGWFSNYTIAFSLSAPKKSLHDLTALMMLGLREISESNTSKHNNDSEDLRKYQHLVGEMYIAFVDEGILIDTGSNYLSHWLIRNNKTFINGSYWKDILSRNDLAHLQPPFSLEQQLQFVIWTGETDQVKNLLKQGVDLNKTLSGIKNPLHTAAHLGNLEIAKVLVESKVPVNQIDHTGATPLYWATRSGHFDVVQFLLKHGAYPDTKNSKGWTPLQEAAENGFPEIVELLLSKGANINAQDNDGRTALFWAARNGQNDVIRLLLNKGADPELRNIRGLNAADVAQEYGFTDAAHILQSW